MLLHDSPLGYVLPGVIHDWLLRLGGDLWSCPLRRWHDADGGGDAHHPTSHAIASVDRKYRRKYRAVSRRYRAKVAECLKLAAKNQAMRDEIDGLQAKLLASAGRFKSRAFELQCELQFAEPTIIEPSP